MKINIKAFTLSFTIIMVILILIISIWSRVSIHFGKEFMNLYNSVHPHPFRATAGDIDTLGHFFGVGLDVFYAFVDSLIFSLGFGFLYNWFCSKTSKPAEEEKE